MIGDPYADILQSTCAACDQPRTDDNPELKTWVGVWYVCSLACAADLAAEQAKYNAHRLDAKLLD